MFLVRCLLFKSETIALEKVIRSNSSAGAFFCPNGRESISHARVARYIHHVKRIWLSHSDRNQQLLKIISVLPPAYWWRLGRETFDDIRTPYRRSLPSSFFTRACVDYYARGWLAPISVVCRTEYFTVSGSGGLSS